MNEPPVDHLAPLLAALGDVDERWLAALGGLHPSAVIDDDVDAMTDAGLVALNQALGVVVNRAQALHAHVASGISKRSAPELGKDGLARKAGFRSPAKLIAASTGSHPGDAKRLIRVGDATAGRMTFTGERAPAKHPHVAAALERADGNGFNVAAAEAITSLLDKLPFHIDRTVLDEAEKTLVEQAAGLDLNELQAILRRAEAWLDPDGLEPKIDDLRSKQYLKIWEDQHGMIGLDGRFAPNTGAPIKAAIEALVTAQIRATRGHNDPGSGDGTGTWVWDNDTVAAAAAAAAAEGVYGTGAALDSDAKPPISERRTVQQLQADALAAIAKHVLGCDKTALPLAGTTVIVRMSLESLQTGTGIATIDGIAQPVDAGTARQMAADAEIIPIVLGAESEVLDLGRKRRLFTKAQRLALYERDGGCVGCGGPPGICEAHHLNWWSKGGGTSVNNGVLLCTSCHHTIHTEDWDIRVDGPNVWLIPPAHIDPTRTPRLGGRRRRDYRHAA